MKKFIKYVIYSLGILFSVLIISLVTWYSVSFLQYKDEIDLVLFNLDKEYQEFDNSLYKLSIISEGEEGIKTWAARRTYWNISYNKSKKSHLVWQFNNLLWYFSIQLHYNQKEIFKLWSHYSLYTSDGYGLNKAAIKYFGKNISELSLKEKAAIVAMVGSPKRYKPGSDKSEERVKYLLEKYNNS